MQWDPLDHYLIVLAMDALSFLPKRARDVEFVSSSIVEVRSGKGLVMYKLMFMDNTLIFYDL